MKHTLLFLLVLLPVIASGDILLSRAVATASSPLEAKEEAVNKLIENTMQAHREFHLSTKLNQQGTDTTIDYPMLVDEWFVSPLIEKAFNTVVKTTSVKKGAYTQVIAGLTADGLRTIYRQTISYLEETVQTNDLNQLKLRFWTANQLEYFLRAFPEDTILELAQMQSYANSVAVKFAESMTSGSVTFVGVTDDMSIMLNNQVYTTSTIHLFPGTYNFSATRPGHYPLQGILSIQPRDNQVIELPMVQEPFINPRVYLSTNLPGNLMPYIRRTFDSYGWKIDTKASATLKIKMKRDRVIKDSSVYVYSLALSYKLTSKKVDATQDPEQVVKMKRYSSNIDIGKNDVAVSLREQRILVIQSLIQFLASFNQQDFELLSTIEE